MGASALSCSSWATRVLLLCLGAAVLFAARPAGAAGGLEASGAAAVAGRRAAQMLRHHASSRSPPPRNHEHEAKRVERERAREKEKAQTVVNEQEEKRVERANEPAVQQRKDNMEFIELCRLEEREAQAQAEEEEKAKRRQVLVEQRADIFHVPADTNTSVADDDKPAPHPRCDSPFDPGSDHVDSS